MPTRVLRDGILTSERIALLGWAEEVFYRRLMSVADDHGRFYAHPSLIRAACYPLVLDKVSDSDIEKWLTACVDAALVRVYRALDRKCYLEILDFGQRVQSKSKFPDPDAASRVSPVDAEKVREDAECRRVLPGHIGASPELTVIHGGPPKPTALVGDGVEDGDGVDAGAKPPPEKPATAVICIPLNDGSEYPITQQTIDEFRELYPAVDVLQELRNMRGWSIANKTKRKTRGGVLRFVTGWLAKEQDSGKPTPQRAGQQARMQEL